MDKYKLLILIMFIFCVTTISKVNAKIKNYSLLGRCIYLDAGHGGVDSGAISNNFLEKDMNLLLVEKLANELFYRGAMVFLTRDGDYDLANTDINRKRNDLYGRVKLINSSNCDMYISIHMNASDSNKWSGIQVFYSDIKKENKRIQVIKEAGYVPIRIMFFEPNRAQAIRIQATLKKLYEEIGGEYYSGEDAWNYLKHATGIDLKEMFNKIKE